MKLFFIPSWYPNPAAPLAGIFIREQAEAIADLEPTINVIVSTWGHDLSFISSNHIRKSCNSIAWYIKQRKNQKTNQVSKRNKIYELFNPALTWSMRLPIRGIDQLINTNRKNLSLAIDRFGFIDLIHAHVSYPAGYIASVLSQEFSIPYVLTEHMSPFPFQSMMRRGKIRIEIEKAFKHSRATVAISPSLAQRIASFGYPFPIVIPEVVDERRFDIGQPRSKKFVFFTLCFLTEQKGIDYLLESIALWDPPAKKFEFRIGGDGPMAATYQALAQRLGIADRIRWLGLVNRASAPKLFKDCHIFVLPSRHESFGVVFAEAIASGKPIIATRCGGPEFIVNKINGQLVDIGDIGNLACVMKYMATNWSTYDPQCIRDDFLRRFSRSAIVNQLLSIYQTVLKSV